MKHFAGLDVSLGETAICVVDEAGGIVREARVPSEPEALVAFFQGLGLVLERIGLEACSLSAWLHEGLVAAGLPAVCLEARRAKAAMGAMPNKTDRNDARGLAQIVRPDRFRRSRDVGAHLGLTPKRHQSGETDVQGGISRCGDELARTALYEAAHSPLVRSRKWSALRAWGLQVAKRRGMARARVAVARKLACVLHRMWADDS